jgi:hypothetical protein
VKKAEVRPIKPKFVRLEFNGAAEAKNEYEEGETMSDQTHLPERIMGLRVELNHFSESSRQQQCSQDAELSRLRHENRNLQTQLNTLQAENNTLRVQLAAGLSVISFLERRLKLHLKFLLEQEVASPRPRIG